jgi:SAM-dependent methyltransferase
VQFYNDLADYYELIFPDWEGSMARQGAAISEVLLAYGPRRRPAGFRVLDAAAGIGTQALPLASAGFEVTARDVSERAVGRLRHEAGLRGLSIDVGQADMRELADSVSGPFDAVICFDNSVPHLLTDSEIRKTFAGFREVLSQDGLLLLSVRDYEQVDRSPESVHPYGERTRGNKRFRLRQEWTWLDSSHYRTTFCVEEYGGTTWSEVVRTSAQYYAVPVPQLLGLMEESGFSSRIVIEVPFYQPMLIGRCAGHGQAEGRVAGGGVAGPP